MGEGEARRCTAFEGTRRIAAGTVVDVALAAKEVVDRGPTGPVLVFDDHTSHLVELDLRGTPAEVAARLHPHGDAPPAPRRGPGRPRLGVVSKEVTLLPRHWAWLGSQRGGASATLRRLVDRARRESEAGDAVRAAQDATYRFLSAMVGNEAGFEEATRALFAGSRTRFLAESEGWPPDLREHARRLADGAFVAPAVAPAAPQE